MLDFGGSNKFESLNASPEKKYFGPTGPFNVDGHNFLRYIYEPKSDVEFLENRRTIFFDDIMLLKTHLK